VTKAPQSSPAPSPLPITCALLLGALVLAGAHPALAQQRVRITAQTPLLKSPDGPILGRVERGLELTQGRVDRKAVEVTVDGWIFARSLGTTTREGFNAIVNDGQGQNLRGDARPDGRLLGRLSGGALVQRLETKDGWAHVRRQAWVARLAAELPAAAANGPVSSTSSAPSPSRDTTPRVASSGFGDGSRATAPRGATLTEAPGGGAGGARPHPSLLYI
jgi:hypothetical protein